jgi:hypothetical protein
MTVSLLLLTVDFWTSASWVVRARVAAWPLTLVAIRQMAYASGTEGTNESGAGETGWRVGSWPCIARARRRHAPWPWAQQRDQVVRQPPADPWPRSRARSKQPHMLCQFQEHQHSQRHGEGNCNEPGKDARYHPYGLTEGRQGHEGCEGEEEIHCQLTSLRLVSTLRTGGCHHHASRPQVTHRIRRRPSARLLRRRPVGRHASVANRGPHVGHIAL